MSTRVQPGKTAMPEVWGTDLTAADYVGIAQAGRIAQPLTAYVSGVASAQMTNIYLYGVSSLEGFSTNGTVTLELTTALEIRTVNVYNDAAKTNLLATGTTDGDGTVTLAAQGAYGVYGTVDVVYTGAEDATVTVYNPEARLFIDHIDIAIGAATNSAVSVYAGSRILFTTYLLAAGTSHLSLPTGGFALAEGETLVAIVPSAAGHAIVTGWSEVPE